MTAERIVVPVGQTFGRLRILREVTLHTSSKRTIECQCSCGAIVRQVLYQVLRGTTKSCGCLRLDKLRENQPRLAEHAVKSGVWRANNPERACGRCGGVKQPKAEMCRDCRGAVQYERRRTNPRRWLDKRTGYIWIEHPGRKGQSKVYEHIDVVEKAMGRELLPGENVHHKNGVKSDNRLENLELWVRMQPSGQRAVDLVVWAREVLDRYAALAEREDCPIS